jgi:hypothetical protein
MRFRLISLVSIGLLLLLVVGCSDSTPQNTAPTPTTTSTTTPAASQAETPKHAAPAAPPPEAFAEVEKKPAAPPKVETGPVSPTPRPGMTIEKADVGSGEKGHYDKGIITTPVSTYFRAQERITFYIQLPEFLRAYKFEHDFKGPKTNEEYMKEIIKKNNVRLPDLPPGHRYIYDPKEEQLMVEKPIE